MPSYTLYYFNGRGRAEICRMMFNAAGVNFMDKRFEFSEWDRYRNEMPSMCVPVLEIDGKYKMPETMAISRYLAREFGFYPKNPTDMMRCDYICDCFYEIMHDYMRYYHWKNGRFRNNMMSSGMMSSGMMSSGMSSSGMSPSGMNTSGMMGSNMGPSGMMGSNMGSSGMMGSNMGQSGMMGSDNMNSGMSSGMMSSDMSSYDNYMYWRYMNTFNRIMPFMERTLSMRNGGNNFFMGDMMMWCDMMFYCCMENMYMQNQSMFSSYPRLMALYNRVAAHPKICSYLKRRCNTSW